MNLMGMFDTLKNGCRSILTLWRYALSNGRPLSPKPYRHASVVLLLSTLSPNALAMPHTEMQLTRPFVVDSAHPGYKTPRSLKGHCVSQSSKIKREDAYLCWSNDMVLDPCFAPASSPVHSLYCILHPWDEEAIVLTLTSPVLPAQQESLNMHETLPWGIELEGDIRCEHLYPEIHLPQGQAAYRCTTGAYLLLPIAKCKQPWSIHSVYQGTVSTHDIKRVIF